MNYNNKYFKMRAMEEIQRAKRYPSFVSLLSIDLSHIDSGENLENFESIDKFYKALKELIGKSIRETDLVSDIYGGKLAILLIETPISGAQILSERLKKSLKYFLCNNTKSPLSWKVPSRETCFPSSENDEYSLLKALDEIN
jgi:diguanylate cyclase (GGDEF)-like protein